jgi:preprotein translocase subunit SecF
VEFFRIKRDIPFMRHALVFNIISLVTFLLAVISLATKGLHFGVDFTGGTVLEIHYPKNLPDLDKLRERVAKLGYTDVAVQNFGTARDVMMRLPLTRNEDNTRAAENVMYGLALPDFGGKVEAGADKAAARVTITYPRARAPGDVTAVLKDAGIQPVEVTAGSSDTQVSVTGPVPERVKAEDYAQRIARALVVAEYEGQLRRVEFVGPQVGRELAENGALALLFVSIGIVVYLWFRFEWKFGLAAIIANLHDVVIILGFFSFFQWEFSLPVLAAVLAVLGYSVNESVVVFDRIRENFRRMRRASVTEIIDNAITRTMSRTIITHGSTQMMVTSMLFFGGETLFYFALALTIGICFGIYSSVLVASPIVMWLGIRREDLVKPEAKPRPDAVV